MKISVKFFASLADIVKSRSIDLELDRPAATVGEVFSYLSARHPGLDKYAQSIMLAVNGEFVTADTLVKSGDEVAFLPPVSGGLWSS